MLPGWAQPYPWKRLEKQRHDNQEAFFLRQLDSVRCRMDRGDETPSFARSYYDQQYQEKPLHHTNLDAAWCIGALALMSVFTASGPIISTIKALTLYPAWAAKVHAELDAFVGADRMPEISDMPNLPTLRACIREALRCWPPVPTGIPHESEADDVFNGYFIPKGSSIFPLELAMCRDPAMYPDPYTYNPSRWLDPAFTTTYREPLTQFPTMVGATAFGWGRRYCQGQELSQHEAFMAVASVMWAFEVSLKEPEKEKIPTDGEELMAMPRKWQESLIVVRPAQVDIVVSVRGEERRKVLEQVMEEFKKD
jgi:hypothetical protein